MNPGPRSNLKRLSHFTRFVSAVLFVGFLYLARDVLIPVTLGTLLAFFLAPLVNRLQWLGLPTIPAVISAASLVVVALALFVFGLSTSLSGLNEELPKYTDQIKSKVAALESSVRKYVGGVARVTEKISETINRKDPEIDSEGEELTEGQDPDSAPAKSLADRGDVAQYLTNRFPWLSAPGSPLLESRANNRNHDGTSPRRPLYVVEAHRNSIDWKTWAGGATVIVLPIGTAGLVIVVALFALIYRDDLRDRFVSVVSQGNYLLTADALDEASEKIGKYLMAQVSLNVSYGVVFGVGLFGIGYFVSPTGSFPYILILATLAGLVRFIPYLGPLIGAVVPLLFSTLVFPGFTVTIAVGILILVMEVITNNVIEPWLYGSSTGVSPMAVIIAAIFWGWLWGPIGILLATPLTVCFVVLGKHVPRFRFLATLLSDKPQVPPAVRFYQRLLSADQHKIDLFIKEEINQKPPADWMDQSLVPLIKLIEHDSRESDRNTNEIYQKLELAMVNANLIDDRSPDGPGVPAQELESGSTPVGDAPAGSATGKQLLADGAGNVDEEANHTGHVQSRRLKLVLIPTTHRGDYLASLVTAKAFQEQYLGTVMDVEVAQDGEEPAILELKPDVIVICLIPPQGLGQARLWISGLREAGFQGSILVSSFGKFQHAEQLSQGFRKRGADRFTTSAQQLFRRLKVLARKLDRFGRFEAPGTHSRRQSVKSNR